jgi:pilus assembly protein FimV
MRLSRKILLTVVLSLASGFGWSLGMGEISAQSHLGQPLDARISLNEMGDFSPDQLKIAIASAEEHRRFGVEPVYQLRNIRMSVVGEGNNAYLQLTSREPVVEPYLDFVVTLRWADGALVKNFTLLFDPPELAASRIENTSSIASRQKNSTDYPAEKKPQSGDSVEQIPLRDNQADSPILGVDGQYLIRPGDSLWRIAMRHKLSGVSLQSMMAGIQQTNPQAFVNGDVNRIKVGVSIKIPDREVLATLPLSGDKSVSAVPAATPSSVSVSDEKKPSVVDAAESAAVDRQTAVMDADERAQYQKEIAGLNERVEVLNGELATTREKMTVMQSQMQALIDQYQQLSARDQMARRDIAAVAKQPDQAINSIEASGINQSASGATPWWIHGGYLLAIFLLACWVIWDHWQFLERRLLAKLTHKEDSFPKTNKADSMQTRHVSAPSSKASLIAPSSPDWSSVRRRDDLPSVGDEQRDPLLTASAYAAFGRYDEAEQILSQAIAETPARSDLYLELLQVYIRSANTPRMLAMQDLIAKNFADDAEVIGELNRLR